MEKLLLISSAISVLLSCFFGYSYGETLGLILGFGIGAFFALFLVALSQILANQEIIKKALSQINQAVAEPLPQQTCTKCHKSYDNDSKNCPFCGFCP